MHIIIPMAGTGARFLAAGFKDPKPLIQIDGRPIIEHVVGMFPGESKFTFICNSDHLRDTDLAAVLSRCAPGCDIVAVPPNKLGPVYTTSLAFDRIDDAEEAIVNYCDFAVYWDYADFLAHTRGNGADGAIPAYRGFHPHMLRPTNYAFMRNDRQWMLEIREKRPFTDDRSQEYASSGTYYFRRGEYLKRYFQEALDGDARVEGEFYCSVPYNYMVRDGLRVTIFELEHMLQWGAPMDLEEYRQWSVYFRAAGEAGARPAAREGFVNLVPMAGRGGRFAEEGFTAPKPMLPVGGKPMAVQAAMSLPGAGRNIFVCLGEHLDAYPLEADLREHFPDAEIVRLEAVTKGQAMTVELGLAGVGPDSPVLVGACDNGMIWDAEKYARLIEESGADVIVWTFSRHIASARCPHLYGWARTQDGQQATGVSVKAPISEDPFNDHALVGTFFFRRAEIFMEGLRRLVERDVRVNGEFYVDSLVDELARMGRAVMIFDVDHYVCWGTPDDYRTFEYWQSFFHKCPWHPYSIEKDSTVDPAAVGELMRRYTSFRQPYEAEG